MILILLMSTTAWAQSLDEAVSQAVMASPRTVESLAKVEEAGFGVQQALAAGRPQLSLHAGGTRQDPTVKVPFLNLTIQPEYSYQVSLSARQTLADFGRLHWSTQAAQDQEEASRFEATENQLTVAQETAMTYLESLLAAHSVEAAQDELEGRKEQLRVAEKRYQEGAVAKFDVIRSRAELASAQEHLLETQNSSRLSQASLDSLAGSPIQTHDIATPLPPPNDLEGALRKALSRPALRALESQVEAARGRMKLAKSSNNPRLAVQTDYLQRTATGFNPGHQWQVAVQLEVPLYDGGLTAASVGKAGSQLTQWEARLQEAQRTTRLQTERSYLDLQSRWSRLEAGREKLSQATEARRISLRRYEYGLGTHLELLESESALSAARVELLRARYEYAGAWIAWGRVTDSLSEVLKTLSEEQS